MRRRRTRAGSCGEFVIRGPQPGHPFQVAITTLIDQALGVFDPDANLKGLGGHRHTRLRQSGQGIARAVTHREDHRGTGQTPARGRQGLNPGRARIGQLQSIQARLPMKAHSILFKSSTHVGKDPMKPVCPDMGSAVIGNLFRSSARNPFFQDRHFKRVIDPGVDLAIRVGPRAAFAKKKIGFRVQFARAQKASQGATSLAQRRTPVQEIDLHPGLRKSPGRKNPRRPRADHRHASTRKTRMGRHHNGSSGRLPDCVAGAKCTAKTATRILLGVGIQYQIHMNDEMRLPPPLSGIQGFAPESKPPNRLDLKTRPLGCSRAQNRLIFFEPELEVQHPKASRTGVGLAHGDWLLVAKSWNPSQALA